MGANPDDARLVALGESIYRSHCTSCHGAKLEGQPNWRVRKPDGKLSAPPHDETGQTWHHADEQLFRLTKWGVKPLLAPEGYPSDMPAFGGVLTNEQITAAIAAASDLVMSRPMRVIVVNYISMAVGM